MAGPWTFRANVHNGLRECTKKAEGAAEAKATVIIMSRSGNRTSAKGNYE